MLLGALPFPGCPSPPTAWLFVAVQVVLVPLPLPHG